MNRIRVASVYNAKKYLEQLPDEFKAVKVDSESLKPTVWRRFVRDLGKELNIPTAVFHKDAEADDFSDYLEEILRNQGFETDDFKTTLIVIGNKSGTVSGRIFNQPNYERLITDLRQFGPDYPIFLDTSAVRILFSDSELTEYTKRERLDETLQSDPPTKKINPETIEDLMAQWAEERENFLGQIEALKSRESKVIEQNQLLIEECSQRETELVAAVEECTKVKNESARDIMLFQEQIRALKTEPMEYSLGGGAEEDDVQHPAPILNEHEYATPKRSKGQPTRSATNRINTLFGGLFDPLIANDAPQSGGGQGGRLNSGGQSYSLAKLGLQPWDPTYTSFLNYFETFNASLAGIKISHGEAITLLFSSLPPKYAYLRSVAAKHKDFDMADFNVVANILVKLIVGGRNKIFDEFTMLQKKPNENHLYFFEKLKNYYQWMEGADPSTINDDSTAFRMIKSKMIQSYPSRFVPDFKRRLEGKTKLDDIFEAILDMTENYPDIADDGGDNGGSDVMALRKKNESWQKNVKCFQCGRKGHIKKNCWKRESKTPKDGRKNE